MARVLATLGIMFAIALGLFGCKPGDVVGSPEEIQFAKQFVASIQARDLATIEPELDPRLRAKDVGPIINKIASEILNEPTKDVALVGYNVFALTSTNDKFVRYTTELQYQLSTKWAFAEIVFEKRNDTSLVTSFRVTQLTDSLEHTNRFTLKNRPLFSYATLAIAIFNPVFIIATAVLCFRTPIPKRKWLWMIFVLLGFVQVSVNWTTGARSIMPIAFQILGTGFWRTSIYAPVVIGVSIPIGAIVFLFRRRHWIKQAEPPSSPA